MTYNIFISHSGSYSNQYEKLTELLKEYPYFTYKNYSVPKDDPIHNVNNEQELANAIEKKMLPASCILILAGVYSTYSSSINMEIEIAKKLGKKIIAIEYGGSEKTSQLVKENSDIIVSGNAKSIINAIRS